MGMNLRAHQMPSGAYVIEGMPRTARVLLGGLVVADLATTTILGAMVTGNTPLTAAPPALYGSIVDAWGGILAAFLDESQAPFRTTVIDLTEMIKEVQAEEAREAQHWPGQYL